MTTRRRNRGSSSRGKRPRYQWIHDATLSISIAANGQAIFDMLGNFTGASRLGITLVRLLLGAQVRPGAGAATCVGDHAVGLVTQDAMTALAVPDPGSQDRVNWWMWDSVNARNNVTDEPILYNYDIKTARRLPGEDWTLAYVVDNAASSATSLNVEIDFRLLIRLP